MPAPTPQLAGLWIADPAERWEALGFAVEDSGLTLGGVTINLGGSGRGITAWAIADGPSGEIDGLPAHVVPSSRPAPTKHPNSAVAIDHVVVVTPAFDRTAAALDQAGMPLRRIRDAGTFRQGFRRLGPAILELVESSQAPPGPARFWGLVVIVEDLDALAQRLAEHVGPIKPAVQPGRRIATLRDTAKITPKVAFMDPEPDEG